jgi:large subunit ribosomal protein L35
MPKLKTSKTAAKRFKISGSGKIIRQKSMNNHLFSCKSERQKRNLDNEAVLSKTMNSRVKRLLALR